MVLDTGAALVSPSRSMVLNEVSLNPWSLNLC